MSFSASRNISSIVPSTCEKRIHERKYAVTKEKVGVIPGGAFYQERTREGARAFRLSYAKIPTDAMEEGVARLARAWKSFVTLPGTPPSP
jgi:DNA-binding transcriptional MocR family regulator